MSKVNPKINHIRAPKLKVWFDFFLCLFVNEYFYDSINQESFLSKKNISCFSRPRSSQIFFPSRQIFSIFSHSFAVFFFVFFLTKQVKIYFSYNFFCIEKSVVFVIFNEQNSLCVKLFEIKT